MASREKKKREVEELRTENKQLKVKNKSLQRQVDFLHCLNASYRAQLCIPEVPVLPGCGIRQDAAAAEEEEDEDDEVEEVVMASSAVASFPGDFDLTSPERMLNSTIVFSIPGKEELEQEQEEMQVLDFVVEPEVLSVWSSSSSYSTSTLSATEATPSPATTTTTAEVPSDSPLSPSWHQFLDEEHLSQFGSSSSSSSSPALTSRSDSDSDRDLTFSSVDMDLDFDLSHFSSSGHTSGHSSDDEGGGDTFPALQPDATHAQAVPGDPQDPLQQQPVDVLQGLLGIPGDEPQAPFLAEIFGDMQSDGDPGGTNPVVWTAGDTGGQLAQGTVADGWPPLPPLQQGQLPDDPPNFQNQLADEWLLNQQDVGGPPQQPQVWQQLGPELPLEETLQQQHAQALLLPHHPVAGIGGVQTLGFIPLQMQPQDYGAEQGFQAQYSRLPVADVGGLRNQGLLIQQHGPHVVQSNQGAQPKATSLDPAPLFQFSHFPQVQAASQPSGDANYTVTVTIEQSAAALHSASAFPQQARPLMSHQQQGDTTGGALQVYDFSLQGPQRGVLAMQTPQSQILQRNIVTQSYSGGLQLVDMPHRDVCTLRNQHGPAGPAEESQSETVAGSSKWQISIPLLWALYVTTMMFVMQQSRLLISNSHHSPSRNKERVGSHGQVSVSVSRQLASESHPQYIMKRARDSPGGDAFKEQHALEKRQVLFSIVPDCIGGKNRWSEVSPWNHEPPVASRYIKPAMQINWSSIPCF